MSSPTKRSLDLLREQGYTAQVVEHWNPYSKTRLDLFGCIDIVAVKADALGVLGVQATTTGNMAKRLAKATLDKRICVWLDANNRFEVWGWAKRGPRGKRKVWTLKVVPL